MCQLIQISHYNVCCKTMNLSIIFLSMEKIKKNYSNDKIGFSFKNLSRIFQNYDLAFIRCK